MPEDSSQHLEHFKLRLNRKPLLGRIELHLWLFLNPAASDKCNESVDVTSITVLALIKELLFPSILCRELSELGGRFSSGQNHPLADYKGQDLTE